MIDTIKKNYSKSLEYISREGVGEFAYYVSLAIILGLVSYALRPFKRRSQSINFYKLFDNFVIVINGMSSPRVLEIGSRNVRGYVRKNLFHSHVDYIGFDIIDGDNVDVQGDVHELSHIVPHNSYDAVFSISVFEHIAMPWKAVLEINKILKPGGLLYISTHPAWPAHELPWDFWRYSCETFRVLLNSNTGFEIIECAQGNPARQISLSMDPTTQGLHRATIWQSIAVIAIKRNEPSPHLDWNLTANDVLTSSYPLSSNNTVTRE